MRSDSQFLMLTATSYSTYMLVTLRLHQKLNHVGSLVAVLNYKPNHLWTQCSCFVLCAQLLVPSNDFIQFHLST